MRPTWSMLIILFISKYMTAPATAFTLTYSNRFLIYRYFTISNLYKQYL